MEEEVDDNEMACNTCGWEGYEHETVDIFCPECGGIANYIKGDGND